MTLEFRTRQFEFSHGHAPRGVGSWAFDVRVGSLMALTRLRAAVPGLSFAARPGKPSPIVRVDDNVPGRIWVSETTYGAAKDAVRHALRSCFPEFASTVIEVEVLP